MAAALGRVDGDRADRRPPADARGDQRRRDRRPRARRGGRDGLGSLPVPRAPTARPARCPAARPAAARSAGRHGPGCRGTSTSATAATGAPRGGRRATATSGGIDPRDAVDAVRHRPRRPPSAARPAHERRLRLRPAVRRGPGQHGDATRRSRSRRGHQAEASTSSPRPRAGRSRGGWCRTRPPELARERRGPRPRRPGVPGEDSDIRGADGYDNIQQIRERSRSRPPRSPATARSPG